LKSKSFLEHVQSLLVRLAVVRLLLISHPRLPTDPDAAAVEVYYSFSRAVEHNEKVLPTIMQALYTQNMQSMAHFVALAKM
jgi:hypothetical protein